jgi:hypothetical protein
MSLRDISDITRLGVVKKIIEVIDYFMSNDIDASRVKGQLDISNIPPAGLDNVIKVDTVTDMLALTVDDVQNGDTGNDRLVFHDFFLISFDRAIVS